MNLCECQTASLLSCRESLNPPSATLVYHLAPRDRMCVMRIVHSACAAALSSFPGKMLWMCLFLDVLCTVYVYHAAPLPMNKIAGEVMNQSSDASSATSSRSSLLSLASHIAAPSAALLPSSLSLSSSKAVEEKQHGNNVSRNETGVVAGSSSSDMVDNSNRSALTNVHPKGGVGDTTPTTTTTTTTTNNNNNSDNKNKTKNHKQAVSSPRAGKARKEFPLALVVASATAAVSILLFFCFSYLWHTRQLDRRAQKLAIRLAAEVNSELKCKQCRPVATFQPGSSQDSGSDSGGEDSRVWRIPTTVLDDLNSLNEEDEEEAEDGSRRKPGGVGRTLGTKKGGGGGGGRGKGGGRRSGSRSSSRKWSGHSGGGQTRASLVTDQEILSHFASRRHSTFFI